MKLREMPETERLEKSTRILSAKVKEFIEKPVPYQELAKRAEFIREFLLKYINGKLSNRISRIKPRTEEEWKLLRKAEKNVDSARSMIHNFLDRCKDKETTIEP